MHSKLEDWKNGWFGLELGISKIEIDELVRLLTMLKRDDQQHFHLSSDYKGGGGVGDITVYVKTPDESDNMEIMGRALGPGEEIVEDRKGDDGFRSNQSNEQFP